MAGLALLEFCGIPSSKLGSNIAKNLCAALVLWMKPQRLVAAEDDVLRICWMCAESNPATVCTTQVKLESLFSIYKLCQLRWPAVVIQRSGSFWLLQLKPQAEHLGTTKRLNDTGNLEKRLSSAETGFLLRRSSNTVMLPCKAGSTMWILHYTCFSSMSRALIY